VKENEYFKCQLYKILKKFASFCFLCYNAPDVFFIPLTRQINNFQSGAVYQILSTGALNDQQFYWNGRAGSGRTGQV
jgi:hypothetical protein